MGMAPWTRACRLVLLAALSVVGPFLGPVMVLGVSLPAAADGYAWVAAGRDAVLERTLPLPTGIDIAALREQLRAGYSAELDRAGRVIITTRKQGMVDRIEVDVAERRLVARFYRTGAAVNPKYAANELDGVLKTAEYLSRRQASTTASAVKRGRGTSPSAPSSPGAVRPPADRAAPVPPPAPVKPAGPPVPPPADGERWPI